MYNENKKLITSNSRNEIKLLLNEVDDSRDFNNNTIFIALNTNRG